MVKIKNMLVLALIFSAQMSFSDDVEKGLRVSLKTAEQSYHNAFTKAFVDYVKTINDPNLSISTLRDLLDNIANDSKDGGDYTKLLGDLKALKEFLGVDNFKKAREYVNSRPKVMELQKQISVLMNKIYVSVAAE